MYNITMRYKVDYHSIPNYATRRHEMMDWCNECVGTPSVSWRLKNWKWYFRFKKDYALFLLRWS